MYLIQFVHSTPVRKNIWNLLSVNIKPSGPLDALSADRSDGGRGVHPGGGRRRFLDAAVPAGVRRHGVRRRPALRPAVPGDPEEQQHRGLLHPGLPGSARSQHPADILLVEQRNY